MEGTNCDGISSFSYCFLFSSKTLNLWTSLNVTDPYNVVISYVGAMKMCLIMEAESLKRL